MCSALSKISFSNNAIADAKLQISCVKGATAGLHALFSGHKMHQK